MPKMKFGLVLVGVLAMLALGGSPAEADQYHIFSFGERTTGPSVPGDWTPANCYPDLTTAANSYTAADTVLFFSETHHLPSVIQAPAMMGNFGLDGDNADTIIQMGPNALIEVIATQAFLMVRGLTFKSDGEESDRPTFLFEGNFATPSEFNFQHCLFQENLASDVNYGGGSCLQLQAGGNQSQLQISHCVFQDNVNRGKGGALYIRDGYVVNINDTVFLNNESRNRGNAQGLGGAIAIKAPAGLTTMDLVRVDFQGNKAWGPGGSIFIDDASLSMIDCQMRDSESGVEFFSDWIAGAGILMRRTAEAHLDPISLVVQGCTFEGSIGHIDTNPWAGDGGAILVKGIDDRYVDVTVSETTFANNFNAQGSGIYIGRFATGEVTRCRFLNNTAYLQGGATFKGGAFEANLGETAVYRYCEFVGNRAGLDINDNPSTDLGRGGVFSNRLNTRAEFYNCTFYNNTVHGQMSDGDAIMLPAEGGEFWSDLQRCVFVNNVFYGEGGNSVQISADEGSISSISHCAFEAGEVENGGVEPVASMILTASPFTGNGLLSPGPGSPLIDAALENGQTMDLPGEMVPQGDGPDIGAYEARVWSHAVDLPEARTRLTAFPNPFNPQTVVHFNLVQSSPVQLDVMDVAGKKVRTLFSGHKSAGAQQFVWDGRNDYGEAAASGLYFARLSLGGNISLTKMTLLK